jgi:hypothetical protein
MTLQFNRLLLISCHSFKTPINDKKNVRGIAVITTALTIQKQSAYALGYLTFCSGPAERRPLLPSLAIRSMWHGGPTRPGMMK